MRILVKKEVLNKVYNLNLKKIEELVLDFSCIDFAFNKERMRLLDIVDELILNNKKIKLKNLPFCLVLGYYRYCEFSKETNINYIKRCKKCAYEDRCKGVSDNYIKKIGKNEIVPIGKKHILNNREKCVLKVLENNNNSTTEEILKLAKNYNICSTCDDGSELMNGGESLILKGLVERKFKEGKYIWKII